jgi:subtilisin family serine protease
MQRLRSIAVCCFFLACSVSAAGPPRLSTKYLFVQPNASAPAPIIRAGADRVPDQYIVAFRDDVLATEVADLARTIGAIHGFQTEKIWSNVVKGMFVKMTESQAQAVARDPFVKYVEENAQWHLSASQQTYIDPRTCNPATGGGCASVVDDRLWHLDRLDQNYALPNNSYSYCTDGTGVTVYVVDTGVNKYHNEFGPSGARVQSGFNATGDQMPADDPCLGFAVPPSGFYSSLELDCCYRREMEGASHGTGVASALGGRWVGVAKNVTIVPIKTARCDQYSARWRLPNHFYQQNQTIFLTDSQGHIKALYKATNSGTTSSTASPLTIDPPDPNWPTGNNQTTQDGSVLWQVVPSAEYQNFQTTQNVIDGLNWILSPSNPGPKSYAVVTLSTYRLATDAGVAGSTGTLEAAIRSLLAANITVIASANNQNGNACDTSPSRMSINNPDPTVANNVITAGGSMIRNRPWPVDILEYGGNAQPADGGVNGGPEPSYDQTKAVRDARWICGAGDADTCPNSTPTATISTGNAAAYYGFGLAGSNAGPCVTLFVPAKNLSVASLGAANSYRDGRIRVDSDGVSSLASGTSFSAPIVAGFAARILQSNPTYSPAQVRDGANGLLSNSVSTLETGTVSTGKLNTFDASGNEIAGTPNKFLRLGDINITSNPSSTAAADSGTTQLTVVANGTATVFYQWYEVNSDFDYATYKNGAYSSTLVAGQTSSTFNAPASSTRRAYWARVTNSCASADSDIAVVVPKPGAPTFVTTSTIGNTVTVTWSAGSGAEQYQVQRKVAGQPWTVAGTVNGSTFSFNETPSAPGGMVVYRVLSQSGLTWLPPNALSNSSPSNNDFANIVSSGYEQLVTQATTVKAQHLIELRQAVNALCDAVGAPLEYQTADLQLSALQGTMIYASDFNSLMTHINNIRTNPLLGLSSASFTGAPASGSVIQVQHLQSLRDAIQK